MSFPLSPSLGQIHTTAAGQSWKYLSGNRWVPQGKQTICNLASTPNKPTLTSGVDPANLSTLTPSPGDIIILDGATKVLSFNESISGWVGTQQNPILLLGNSSIIQAKALEFEDCQWVYVFDLTVEANTNGNNIFCANCQNMVFDNISCDDASGNNMFITANENGGSGNIRILNCSFDNFGSDGLSIHASNTTDGNGHKYENGANFYVYNCTSTNSVNTGENAFDFTSGTNLYLIDCTCHNNNLHINHGVTNAYIDNFTHTKDGGQTNVMSVELRNTKGDIWVVNSTLAGEIDLGLSSQEATRPNYDTVNNVIGIYGTYELTTYNNTVTGGIDNNTSGSGTIVTAAGSDPMLTLIIDGFGVSCL